MNTIHIILHNLYVQILDTDLRWSSVFVCLNEKGNHLITLMNGPIIFLICPDPVTSIVPWVM